MAGDAPMVRTVTMRGETFVALEDFEAGFGPELAAIPVNSEPRQRRRATAGGCCAKSLKFKRASVVALAKAAVSPRRIRLAKQAEPKEFSALHEAHFTAPPERRGGGLV